MTNDGVRVPVCTSYLVIRFSLKETSMKHSNLSQQPHLVLGSPIQGRHVVTLTGQEFSRHKWLLGVSGSGKSSLLAWIAVSLLRQNIAFMLIDPHGDLTRLI